MQESKKKSFWSDKKKRNKIALLVFILVSIFLIYYNGDNLWKYSKSILNLVEKVEVDKIESINDSLSKKVSDLVIINEELKNKKTVIINFKDEFKEEQKRADSLQLLINNIHYRTYTKSQLDSLADYYRYK